MSDETMAELVRQVQEERPLIPGAIDWPDSIDPFEVELATVDRCNRRLTEQRQKYEKEIILLRNHIAELERIYEAAIHEFFDDQ